ncbi:MAG: hypothetical protein GX897_09015 [Clostridiales bacterium]|nr:hypothetical protein [Clostridiales bacterium]
MKKGRARFVSENHICLTVPKSSGNSVFEESGRRELPIYTEEEQALNNEINNGALNTEYENQAAAEPVDNGFSLYTVDYMLQKIDELSYQTEHLERAFAILEYNIKSKTSDDMQERTPRQFAGQFAGVPGAPGNLAGQAMADAAARIFVAREQTIRETINMYRNLLYDILGKDETN